MTSLMVGLAVLAHGAAAAPVSLESAAGAAAHLRLSQAQIPQEQQALLERLNDLDPTVVAKALKDLSRWAIFDSRIEEALADFAEDGNKSLPLRALAWKCLSGAAANPDARARLQTQLADTGADVSLREAAAWGLWEDGAVNTQTRVALMTTALDWGEPPALRQEALKSLYLAMPSGDARDTALELAQDAGAPESLRLTAVLLLHAVRTDWKVQPVLDALSRSGDAMLRQAAQEAATPGMTPMLTRYFHLAGVAG